MSNLTTVGVMCTHRQSANPCKRAFTWQQEEEWEKNVKNKDDDKRLYFGVLEERIHAMTLHLDHSVGHMVPPWLGKLTIPS